MSIQLTKVKSVFNSYKAKSYFKINSPVPRGAHLMRVTSMHFKSVLGYSRHHINLIWMSFLMRKYSLGLVSVWHGSLRNVLFLAMTSFCKDVHFFHQKNFFSKFHILKFNMSTFDVWILFFWFISHLEKKMKKSTWRVPYKKHYEPLGDLIVGAYLNITWQPCETEASTFYLTVLIWDESLVTGSRILIKYETIFKILKKNVLFS